MKEASQSMLKFRYLKVCTIAIVLLFNQSLNAAKSYTWDGSVSSDWNTNGNWDDIPGSNGNGVYLVEGPGTYTNAPIISSTPSFTMSDLGISGGTNLSMTGGTITIPGDFAIAEGSDFLISGGTLNVQGSLYLADDGSTISVSGGNLIVSGDINLGSTDGVNSSSGSNGSTVFSLSSGNISCGNLVFSNETGDTHSISLTGGSLAVSGDIRSDGEDVVLSITGPANVTIGDDLLMTGGNDLISMSDGTLTIAGDWNNQGGSNITAGSIVLNGFLDQDITNPNGESFFNLTVNTVIGSILLNDSIIIKNDLTLTNGIISTNGNSVTFLSGSNVSNASSASFIDGPVSKIGNSDFTFPLGSGFSYSPLNISAPNSVSDVFQARYYRTNPNGLYPLANKEAGIVNLSQLEYWTLDRLVGTSSETVTLSWNSSSLVQNIADLLVCRWDDSDSEWKNEGNGGTTGDATSGTVSSSGTVSNFSPFTLGSSSPSNPLPVELLNFNLRKEKNIAQIRWSTSSEINNNYFIIEKSLDGKLIEEIGIVNSKAENGNSNNKLEYSFQDKLEHMGAVYYRLKQVDHDGSIKTYPFSSIFNSNNWSKNNVLVYPNPTTDHFFIRYKDIENFSIEFTGMDGKTYPLEYYKISGTTLRCNIDKIKPGFYVVNLIDNTTNELKKSEKIIIN